MISFPIAKINIGLRVIGRRPDNFHDIESIFYPVGIHDILEIIRSDDGSFQFSHSGLTIPGKIADNLVVRTFNIMKERFSLPQVHVHLHKVIPPGSGMGGGSSNAAATILLLNRIFTLDLTAAEMSGIAAGIGSDCPFFVDPKPSLVTGKGDISEAIPLDLSEFYILMVFPAIHVSTASAYSKIKVVAVQDSLKNLANQDIDNWKDTIVNDFESVIFSEHPEIRQIKDYLYTAGAVYASMSGSGSAVYGIFKTKVDANFLPRHYYTYICKAKATYEN